MMQERKIRLAIFVVIGLLVGGIILDALSRFTVVNSAIATLVRPINFIVGGAASGARSVSDFFTSKGTLQKENAALKTENDDLRQNNVELIAMKAENERLSKLLKFKELKAVMRGCDLICLSSMLPGSLASSMRSIPICPRFF